MQNGQHNTTQEPRVFSTLKSDLGRGDFLSSIGSEFSETREFLLDQQRKDRLETMGPLKRWWMTGWWMLKAMFFKLTPARRILFVAGILFVSTSRTINLSDSDLRLETDTNVIGILCLVVVLMLELKDKLVAREELEAGRIVQDALKPELSPKLPGWNMWLISRSANEVGGDLIDFIRISEDRVGIVLGDVAGKGLRAALVMVRLQATLRALAGDYSSLSTLAAKLNDVFCRDCMKNFFASMVYFEIDPKSGHTRILNAGHFPPLIVRGGKIVKLKKGGAALGIMLNAEYTEEETTLEKGEFFCAYSDGVSEARNEAGEFFGEEGIERILLANSGKPAEAIGAEIVNAVDRFVGNAKISDDLTLVVVGRAA